MEPHLNIRLIPPLKNVDIASFYRKYTFVKLGCNDYSIHSPNTMTNGFRAVMTITINSSIVIESRFASPQDAM